MKGLVLAIVGLAALIGLGFYVTGPKHSIVAPTEPEAAMSAVLSQAAENSSPAKTRPIEHLEAKSQPARRVAPPMAAVSASESAITLALDEVIETLLSPQATFEQKQTVWRQIKDVGQMDQAISDLEQKWAGDPRSAALPTELGQAYLKKAGMTQDIREQAILGTKADKTLDDALALDPSNWEARFVKAVGMSYWP